MTASMDFCAAIARHVREVHFGGNLAGACLRDALAGVTWEDALRSYRGLNPIATLAWHTSYYVQAVLQVMEGGPLDAKDALSFDHPPIRSQEDWEQMKALFWERAEAAARCIEAMPQTQLGEFFVKEKYGTWHRNIYGMTEHMYYHLGQINLIRKLLRTES